MTALRALGLTLIFALSTVVPSLGMSAFAPPVVVFYPLTLSGVEARSEVGSDVSILIGTKVAEGGDVTVRPYTPGTTRPQYLDAAIKQKADYYVTGYLQQIGNDVSMILQVVSTHSGSVVFSSTTTIKTFGDAAAEADPLRAAILQHAGRGLAALDAPPPATVPTAEPTTKQGVNLTRALGRHAKATPSPVPSASSDAGLVPVSQIAASAASPAATALAIATPVRSPSPTPSPVIVNRPFVADVPPAARTGRANDLPVSTILVVDTGGTESAVLRANASASLLSALRRIGVPAARLAVEGSTLAGNAQSICRANRGTERFYEPLLGMSHDSKGGSIANLSVTAVDCAGAATGRRETTIGGTSSGGDASAIDRAAFVLAPQLSHL